MGDFIQTALLNKDVFTTLVVLGVVAYLTPIIITQNKKGQENIKDLITSNKESLDNGFNKISLAVGKNVVHDEMTLIGIGEKAVQSATPQKLAFLRIRLVQNNIHRNPDQIKHQIRTRLMSISENGYIDFLNKFYTPLGLYGCWVSKHFPMDEFLDTVYKIFFGDNTIDKKIELIESIMYDFQSEMWNKFRLELKK